MLDAVPRFLRYHLPALVWAVLAAYLLLRSPPSVTGTASGPIWWMFSQSSYWRDIGMHVVFFGMMSWLAVRSFRALGVERPVLTAVVATVAYGTLLEVIQHFTPGRVLELRDVLANSLGAVVAGWLATKLGPRGLERARAAAEEVERPS